MSPLHYFRAKRYALHAFKAETGWRVILLTNTEAPDWSETLRGFYESVFVPLVIRNPLVTPGEPIVSEAFENATDTMLRAAGASIRMSSADALSSPPEAGELAAGAAPAKA